MKLSPNAMPGVEQHAETAAESACHLADSTGPECWSPAAADDALDAIDTLAGALSALGPDLAAALAPVAAATAHARRQLGDDEGTAATVEMPGLRRSAQGSWRRGLGPGFKGIRMEG
ncbi:hypothetical protein ACGFZJ_41970 [Streptomyces sp. NPDC048253]|uniref:hypothetical protein n=1 Tax=Streptomyces sp. NPDC048253 TaxID=3365524 RepID=UPI0006BB42A1|nr:hypothetical protein OV320_1295 [Actinobacteria bacterium OV320]